MAALSPKSAQLAISDHVQTQSANRARGDLWVQQTTPSVAMKPPTTEQPRTQELVFLAADQQQKRVQLSEVRVEENSEKLAVNVVKLSAEERTTTATGGNVTEEGELHYSAWVFRRFAVLDELTLFRLYFD